MENDIMQGYPQSVYKYYSLNDYNIDAFLNHYLYLSHPFQLNDLMDIRGYAIDMRNITEILYEKLKRQIIHQAPLIVNSKYFNKLFFEKDRDGKILQLAISDSFFCFGGIVSLSTQDRFNELMWSHYTGESGFMVEFDTCQLLNSIFTDKLNRNIKQLYFKPIIYKEHPCSISCRNNPNIQQINLYNSTQKSNEWGYEKEWRIIATSYSFLGLPKSLSVQDEKYLDISKRKLFYNPNAIKRIFLGKKFWTIDNIEQEIRPLYNDNLRFYIIKKRLEHFIFEVCNKHKDKVYMSGACKCAKFEFGTDDSKYNRFSPDYYYLTRSFEKIRNISCDSRMLIVEYEGEVVTSNNSFNV